MENLGEQIYKYRTARGLSQLELAEKLEVSRQSISKWETNEAVPELQKLVKMAAFFEITLDELILNKKEETIVKTQEIVTENVHETVTEIRKEEKKHSVAKTVFGAIFLAVGVLAALYCLIFGDLLAALTILLPFALSAFFCLKQFRFAALWCVHTWFVFAALYCYGGMGISWGMIRQTSFLLSLSDVNPMRIVIAWVLFLALIILIGITVFVYRKHAFAFSRKKQIVFLVGTFATLPIRSLLSLIIRRILLAILTVQEYVEIVASKPWRVWLIVDFFLEIAFIAVFTVFLVPTFYFLIDIIREKRASHQQK